jgi:DNA-binding transcriptional LysR family regulator
MDWQGINEFLAVVESGSFTRAAKSLDVSTSHVSRSVAQLESRLGVALLKRTTRSLNLTEAGQQYAASLHSIQSAMEEANLALQGEQQEPKGTIRVSCAGDFAAKQVAPKLAQFCQRYTQVSMVMDFNNRNVDLIAEGVDLAIRFGRMADSNLIARPLTTRVMTLVASPEYLEKFAAPTHPEQLTEHNCLYAVTNRWRFKVDGTIKEYKISGRWRSNNGEALLQACLSGLGIAHLAQDIVEEYVANGRLVSLLAPYQVADNASWLVYPNRDLMPLRVRLLIDFLIAEFNQD